MHHYLLTAAVCVTPLLPLHAAKLSGPSVTHSPDVVAKTTHRSFGGAIQQIGPDGTIRLRDNHVGDIRVVITAETKISRDKQPATAADLKVGDRVHGSASFRGDKYYAKTLHVD